MSAIVRLSPNAFVVCLKEDMSYLDIHEDDQLDEAQLAAWVKRASQLPGERM